MSELNFGTPMMVGKSAYGKDVPDRPALVESEPTSMTIAGLSIEIQEEANFLKVASKSDTTLLLKHSAALSEFIAMISMLNGKRT